jgi:hypothetical protein
MSNSDETSSSPTMGQRRHGYPPAFVLLVALAAVVIGVVLKNTREQQIAANEPVLSTTGAGSRTVVLE